MTIKEALKFLTEHGGELYCKICTVDTVDEDARTVDVSPLDDSAPILGVNLQANQNAESGFVAFPAENSHVVVAFLNDAAAVVILMEKVAKVRVVVGDSTPVELDAEDKKISLKIGDTTITADSEKKITFNGGDLGGLVVIQKLTDKINALVDAFNSHTHTLLSSTVNVTGSPTAQTNAAPITVPAITSKASKLNKSDYENENIKHG